MNARPLTPRLGTEICGIDLAALSEPDFDEIHQLFLERMLLVFRDQSLSQDEHKALGRQFGPLHTHPSKRLLGAGGDPEIFEVKATPTSRHANGEAWHNDLSCESEPPLGSALYMRELPTVGGDTMFANMYEAYESLSEPIRTLVDSLTAFHDGRKDLASYGIELRPDQDYPRANHPVAPAHPETGRRMLFVNPSFTVKINELEPAESAALLDFLYARVPSQPRLQCRVTWAPGTIVLWDNRCVQHHAVWDYFPASRRGERVTIRGTALTAP